MTSEEDRRPGRQAEAAIGGHICLDIIPEIKGPDIAFAEGFLQEIGKAVVSTGGAVSNTGLAMHRLGIATLLMGKVGNDLFGQALRQIVARHDPLLAEGMIESPDAVTSYSVILSPLGRDRMVLHCPGCNDTFSADEIAYGRLGGVTLFHLGYPPLMRRLIERDGAELVELFRRAKATGVTTSLDMSMPDEASFAGRVDWRTILARALPYVDIFIPSFEETIYTLYRDKFRSFREHPDGFIAAADPDLVRAIGRDLLSLGPKIVGLKLGRFGLYVATAPASRWTEPGRAQPARPDDWHARELWSPGFRVDVVGTTGAGDTTFAGFLAALLRGRSPEACVAFACAVGACNTEAADALGGVRSWDPTWDRIASGWDRLVLPFPMDGWRWQEDDGIWRSPEDGRARE